MHPPEDYVLLARIVRPQGRLGEVVAELHTDFPDTLPGRPGLLLVQSGVPARPCAIERVWLPTGKHVGRIVLKIAGVDSINDAEALRGAELQVPENQKLALASGTYYLSDLIGCTVSTEDRQAGTVTDVHFPAGPDGKRLEHPAPILVLENAEGDEILIPFANEFIASVDIPNRRISMRLPAGLLDVNG